MQKATEVNKIKGYDIVAEKINIEETGKGRR